MSPHRFEDRASRIRRRDPIRIARDANRVLLVVVTFGYDVTLAANDVTAISKAIVRAISGSVKAAMHSKRLIAFVCPTSLSSSALQERIHDDLMRGSVEAAWVMTAPSDVVSRYPLDPLTDRIAGAWTEVREQLAGRTKRPTKQELRSRMGDNPQASVRERLLKGGRR